MSTRGSITLGELQAKLDLHEGETMPTALHVGITAIPKNGAQFGEGCLNFCQYPRPSRKIPEFAAALDRALQHIDEGMRIVPMHGIGRAGRINDGEH